ncbi:MAG: hypothetical protein PVF33_10035 [Candidatus Latescibacterota bacterium]
MHLSTHYYVLSLGAEITTLYEAFRDLLIIVENQGFPVKNPVPPSDSVDSGNRSRPQEMARTVDKYFDYYYRLDPLHLVLVGDEEMKSAFHSVTEHGAAVIGWVEGDHSGTSCRELGKIVWPLVKVAMSGVLDRAMHDLESYAGAGKVTFGIESVARAANEKMPATLLVEDDYHMRGHVGNASESPVVSTEVDVRESIDDAVDAVIELILKSGGNVVFTPLGSLSEWNHVVLLPREVETV